MLHEKLPDALLSAKVVAARENGFSPRNVALTVKTPNQFLLKIEMILRSLKRVGSPWEEKHIDDQKYKVGEHKNDQ